MSDRLQERPKLRPLEAVPLDRGDEKLFALADPSGVCDVTLTLSEPALFILTMFDGLHTVAEILDRFQSRYGQPIKEETLFELIQKLESAWMLDGPAFRAHLDQILIDYRAAKVRRSVYGDSLGSPDDVRAYLSQMLSNGDGVERPTARVVGLVAPHLDYPRGGPCYAKAYGVLDGMRPPDRCVILGTNHFGQSTSVVSTTKPFETPLGVAGIDTRFLDSVSQRCGVDLCEHESDHGREHSVEMQVMCLQHVLESPDLTIVPFLCPDPCGPTGTKPYDGNGVDLADFARALGEVIEEDGGDTLVVAGADLSHVGRQFGDMFELDASFLASVAERDRRALACLEASDPEAFIRTIAAEQNPTRVCSAGCMFVLASALRAAKPLLLGYHQAFTEDAQICVSCSAMTYAG